MRGNQAATEKSHEKKSASKAASLKSEKSKKGSKELSVDQKKQAYRRMLVLRHFELLVQYKGPHIATLEMRKHAAWYMKGIKNAAFYKNLINKASETEEVISVLQTAFGSDRNE